MGPDPEVRGRAYPAFTRTNLASAAFLGAALGAGIALRVARFSVGDYYEDGAAHWWAAARGAQTGVLLDPFDLNTSGYWLPGYDRLAAALLAFTGTTDMVALRLLGVAFYVAAALALLALGKPAGRAVALFAVALFSLSPWDALNAPIAIPVEPAVAFLTAGLALLIQSRGGRPALRIGAVLMFLVAVLFRYEALIFVSVIVLFDWWWTAGRPLNRLHAKREVPLLLFPLLAGALMLALTWGENFPSRLLLEGAPHLPEQEALGLVAQDPAGRNAEFWLFWSGGSPAAVALAAVGAVAYFRRPEPWLAGAFAFLLSVFLYLNLGTPSVRYLQPVEPALWLLAALGLQKLLRVAYRAAARAGGLRRPDLMKPAAAAAAALFVLSATAVAGAAALESVDARVALHGPLYRAAAFVAGQPQNGSLLVLIDSPLAAEASGLRPSRLIGSAMLPETRQAALAFLKDRVQYIVSVNITYYRLVTLFPELTHAGSTQDFSLLFDATGWEIDYSVKTAWVYAVNREPAGLFQFGPDLALRVPFHEFNGSGRASGLHLLHRGADLVAPAPGIGYPTISTPGGTYAPGAFDAVFDRSAGTPAVRANFTMYLVLPGGGLDTSVARAVVSAHYRQTLNAVEAEFHATPPAGATNFTLRVNNSVPSVNFPTTFNDSVASPTSDPYPDAVVWSLQNWLFGDRATLQFDYRAPGLLRGGRETGGFAWMSYEAPNGSADLSYLFHILPAGGTIYGPDEPIQLKAPLFRAGSFLATAPLNDSLVILTDFAWGPYQWVRDTSQLPGTKFVSSVELPATRQEALDWIRSRVEYVVAVNRSSDPTTSLFPELATGESSREFSMVFDAGGPPDSLTQDLVWVYRVNRGDGLVAAHPQAALRFLFDQDANASRVLGLGLLVNGTELVHPSAGVGVPTAVVNGIRFEAGAATLDFVAGSRGSSVEGTFWLYPLEPAGLNRSAAPLVVRATFAYAQQLLAVALNGTPAQPTDNVTLTLNVTAPSASFPTYLNDTAFSPLNTSVERSNIWSLRNWLIGPSAALQADFKDPYRLYFSRSDAGEASFEYEAPAGALDMTVSLWILPSELAPPV